MKKTLRIIWCQRVTAISDRRKLYQIGVELVAAKNLARIRFGVRRGERRYNDFPG